MPISMSKLMVFSLTLQINNIKMTKKMVVVLRVGVGVFYFYG
jgi:hypothetical protein